MKRSLLSLVACLALVGCDYRVALPKESTAPLDPSLVGLWERATKDRMERLLVLPSGPTEYMVAYPFDGKDGMFAMARLCRVGTKTLVELRWIGTAKGVATTDTRIYQFASYERAGDTLRVALLNPSVVSRDTTSTPELVKAIESHIADPALFRDPMVFQRVPNTNKTENGGR